MNDLYQVIEVVDGNISDELTTGPYHGKNTWNNKFRVYRKLSQARVYKNTMRAQGRDARIVRFEPVGEVE